jgi:hypothetical protein
MISYEQDLYAWTLDNVSLLRQGKLQEIDVVNIIEELEYMARKDKKELVSRLVVLLMHLLKWQFQPDKRTRSWVATIKVQRIKVRELLEESPSLKYELRIKFDEAYQQAILEAVQETNLPEETFPPTCPYTFEQVLDNQFYPETEVSA